MLSRETKLLRQRSPGSRELSKSLVKALRILIYLGENGPELGVTEIAQALKLNKSTTYRLLSAMEQFDFIDQDPGSEKYRLGLKLFELGNTAVQSRTLQSQAHPHLVAMSRCSNETVHLGIARDGDVIYLDKIESHNSLISIPSIVGRRLPAHCTGLGKVLLAYLPEPILLKTISARELQRRTEHTITDKRALMGHLRQIRQRGYALDNQEAERGLSCVAAPVEDSQARVVAAISIAGPTIRFRGKELAEKIEIVRKFARKISAELGHRP